jgi:hypothetical protein
LLDVRTDPPHGTHAGVIVYGDKPKAEKHEQASHSMKPIQPGTALLASLLLVSTASLRAAEENPRDWHIFGNISYSSRSLDGSIVNKTAINADAFGSLIATGDSMNVGTSDSAMLALAAQYKRFGIGLNYLPTSYEGKGSALVALSAAEGGGYIKTPLDTNIDIGMLLASVYYNFIQTPETVFGVGVGFGQTSIDLSIVPETGNPIIYEGDQPFGFLNLHFANTYKRFLYGFALNGISADFDGASVVYSDYKVDVGYRVVDEAVKLDIVGGYRQVNFALDLGYDAS